MLILRLSERLLTAGATGEIMGCEMPDNKLEAIRRLVGNVDAEQLQFVESYVADTMGIFIPSLGMTR